MLVKNKKINLCFFLFSGTIVSLSPLYLMACGDNGKPFQNLTVGNNFSIHSKTEAEYLMYRTNICLEIFSQDEISFDFSTITQNAVETKINKLVINGDDSLLTYDLASFIYWELAYSLANLVINNQINVSDNEPISFSYTSTELPFSSGFIDSTPNPENFRVQLHNFSITWKDVNFNQSNTFFSLTTNSPVDQSQSANYKIMFTIKDDVSLISSLSRTFENSLLIINKI